MQIGDGAGFHISGSLRVPPSMTLVRIWNDSPEWNPIEAL